MAEMNSSFTPRTGASSAARAGASPILRWAVVLLLLTGALVALLLAWRAHRQGGGGVSSPSSASVSQLEREYRRVLAADPEETRASYNLGTLLLDERDFGPAREHLLRATEDSMLRARAAYNLGNVDLVPAFEDSALAGRDSALARAIRAYQEALRKESADHDAKWNLELALRLLQEERTPPEPHGGGGEGAGGGGGGGPAQPGGGTPAAPDAAAGQAESSNITSFDLLDQASRQEIELQKELLRKPPPPGPILP